MKSYLVLTPLFILFTLISCSPANQDSEQSQQPPALPQNQEQSTPASAEPAQPIRVDTAEQPSTGQNQNEVRVNPPHGEPNHRCDIPVGAPLDSPAANTTRQPTNNQVQATTPDPANNLNAPTIENAKRLNSSQTQNTTAPAKGAKPRLNPAHGQPWHRCDIAVGSPLP